MIRKIIAQLEAVSSRGVRSTPTEVNGLEFACNEWAEYPAK